MSKRIAPPGKRGSVKREAFKTEDDDDSTPSLAPSAAPPAAPAPAAPAAPAAPPVPPVSSLPPPVPVATGPTDDEIKQRQRLLQEEEAALRAEELALQRRAAEASRLEEERQRLAQEQQAQRAEAERQRELLQKRQQKQQEEEEQAQRETQRQLAQQKTAAAEERQRQLAAEDEARRQRAIDEERLRQERAAALEARRREEAAAAAAAKQALIDAEEAEMAAIDAEARRQAEAERERVKAANRVEAERLKAEEDAEIAEALRRAEEQRRKRASFLSDMDSFSTQFVSQTQEKESALQDAQRQKDALKANIATMPAAPVDQPRVRNHRPAAADDDDLRPLTVVEEPLPPSPTPARAEPAKVTRTIVVDQAALQSRQQDFQQVTSALFAESAVDAASSAAPEPVAAAPAASVVEGEELRMPTRIGSDKAGSKAKAAAASAAPPARPPSGLPAASPAASSSATHSGVRFGGATSPVNTPAAAATTASVPADAEDEEEEGTAQLDSISNILTREERRTMTREEKASWRAKQVDLNTRRKDFHGAVTFMFDGIFSWQMYGSAEALDEFGNTYTEYLMRCQWGTSFENLQPWIVAHRYREFDKLDQDLKKRFPALEVTMPKLPKKEFLWSMETQVVTKRRQALEEYMVKLVQSFPTLLRSDLMDVFLHIAERIQSIKNLLKVAPALSMRTSANPSGATASAAASTSSAAVYEAAEESASAMSAPPPSHTSSAMAGGDPLGVSRGGVQPAARRGSARGGGGPVVVVDEEEHDAHDRNNCKILYWSVDDADRAKEEQKARPLDEDGLGCVEEDLRSLFLAIKHTPAKELLAQQSPVRRLLSKINYRWPALRATCVVNMEVDFILIPRAMQAEEDYLRCLNEYRNLEALHSYR